jgi:1-acyl-sn-glycerol-3-phosphate acyltransferase
MTRTVTFALFMFLFILLVGVPLILYSAIARSVHPMYRAAMWGFRVGLGLAGIHVCCEGLENIPDGVCIFAINHASNIDPPAAAIAIPRRISVLAKKEVFRIPIVGTALRLADIVLVDRSDRDAALGSVALAIKHLKAGISFMVFPEGTRSPDGRLMPFKKGIFVMALQAGVPVVPMSLGGSYKILPKGTWIIRPGEIVVRFGKPVDAAAYAPDRRAELLAEVQRRVAAGLPEDQQPLAGEAEG